MQVVAAKLEYLLKHEAPAPFLLGERFTVADAYCYIVVRAGAAVGVGGCSISSAAVGDASHHRRLTWKSHPTVPLPRTLLQLSWSGYVGVELPEAVKAYSAAVGALPEVKLAHELMAAAKQQ